MTKIMLEFFHVCKGVRTRNGIRSRVTYGGSFDERGTSAFLKMLRLEKSALYIGSLVLSLLYIWQNEVYSMFEVSFIDFV